MQVRKAPRLAKRVVPLPEGLHHTVTQLLEGMDLYDINFTEGTRQFMDLVGHLLPNDFDPETQQIVFTVHRPPTSQVPRTFQGGLN